MKRIILTYGIISGVIIIGSVILGLALGGEESAMSTLEWLGYLIMIVALSVIFVGIKRYRDQELGGVIRFGTAFLLGLGITGVASLIYVGAWEVNLALTDYAFIDQYTTSVIASKTAEGMSEVELQALGSEMEQLKQQYGNLLLRLPMTFLEIFPVGLIVSLVAALVLRNSQVMPAGGGNPAAVT